MATPPNVITINSVSYRLRMVEGAGGPARRFAVRRVAAGGAEEGQKFRVVVPWGNWGMGAHYDTGVRNQHDYGNNVTTEVWNELGAGPDQNAMGYSGATVVALELARDANGRRVLYAGGAGGAAVMKKINIDAASPTDIAGASKTFSGGSTVITDICTLKDGQAPGMTAREAAQQGNGIMLVGFGETRNLIQADTIDTGSSADTYSEIGADAYAGLMVRALTSTNTQAAVWKTTGVSGQSLGPFSRLQYMAISSANANYSEQDNWLPGTPYQAGDPGSSITGLAEFQRGIAVGKPEGVYIFDGNGNANVALGTTAYRHDENAKNLLAVGQQLFVPTIRDLAAIGGAGPDGAIGISRLMSPPTGIVGYPTAVASYLDKVYVAYYTGSTTYIVVFKARQGESVPNPYLIYALTSFSGVCRCMKVATNSSGKTYLFYGKGEDVGYFLIDTYGTSTNRTYETGGTWYSSIFGDSSALSVIERFTFFGTGLATTNNVWTPAYSVDGGSTFNSLTAVDTDGRTVRNLTPGTNDNGYLWQLRLTCTNTTNTNNPRLIGGGVIVDGSRRPDKVDEIIIELIGGAGSTSNITPAAATVYSNLKTLENAAPVNAVYAPFFGDSSNHKIIITDVALVEGPGDGEQNNEIYVTVTARLLAGS